MTTVCANGHPNSSQSQFCAVCGLELEATHKVGIKSARSSQVKLILAIVVPLGIAAFVIGIIVGTSESKSVDVSTEQSTTTIDSLPLATSSGPATAASLPASTTVSSIERLDGIPTVLTGDGVKKGPIDPSSSITVWEFRSGAWNQVFKRVIGLPISAVEMRDLTDDGVLEAKLHGATGSGPGVDFVIGGGKRGWRLIPFGEEGYDSPGGVISFDSGPNFFSKSRSCVPSCAEGGMETQYWKYDPINDRFAKD